MKDKAGSCCLMDLHPLLPSTKLQKLNVWGAWWSLGLGRRLGPEDYRPGSWTCPRAQHPSFIFLSTYLHQGGVFQLAFTYHFTLGFPLTHSSACPQTLLFITPSGISALEPIRLAALGLDLVRPPKEDPEGLRVTTPSTQPPIPPPHKHL